MSSDDNPSTRRTGAPSAPLDALRETFYRVAASGILPARLFASPPPPREARSARTGHLKIEIVSHCWKYAHMLAYQLDSLAAFPPTKASITMTVFHSSEDGDTVRLLEEFGGIDVPGVSWNWRRLDTAALFRRSIGRNLAARDTSADWIWFADCDVFFGEGCLDSLADSLQGRRDALAFPDREWTTPLLLEDDALLASGKRRLATVDVERFTENRIDRAKGGWQITHGDVARAMGYCGQIPFYQQPRTHWNKAYEDRTFRWLLRTEGVAVPVKAMYRIRHAAKGRYEGRNPWIGKMRGALRRAGSLLQERTRRR